MGAVASSADMAAAAETSCGVARDPRVTAVYAALTNGRFDWRSASGIAHDTGLPESQVIFVLENDLADTIVRVAVRDGYLYTTRDHYRQIRGPWNALVSAITGRVK